MMRICPSCLYATHDHRATSCASCGRPLPAIPEWGRRQDETVAPADSDEARHVAWLLGEFEREPLRYVLSTLSPQERATIRDHYVARLTPPPAPVAAASPMSPPVPVPHETPAGPPRPRPALPAAPSVGRSSPRAILRPPRPKLRLGPPPWQTWDSAVILLYLGAFLIVAAGLVYASYNWGQLAGWQRVGLLAAATGAFIAGGLALLPMRRVRPAAETFVGIGALLVPMNVLALHNVFARTDQRPALTAELGTLLIALLYGAFAFRPGGVVYRYAAPAAGLLAVAVLPSALGAHWGWGGVLIALAVSAVPDAPRWLGGRWRRFARPVAVNGLVALPVATLVAIAAAFDDAGSSWSAPLGLAPAALAVGRLALRRASDRLAWLWTGLVAATVVTALLAGARPAPDWAVVAVVMGACCLWLGERGPMLLRRPGTRLILHSEAAVLVTLAPGFAGLAERWLLVTLAWLAATALAVTLARLRAIPWLLGLGGVYATATYLSLGFMIPTRVLDDVDHALLLAPGPLTLAGASLAIGWRLGGSRGRRWSRPLWAVAALAAAAVTLVAFLEVGVPGARDQLVLAAVAALFGIAAILAAGVLRLSWALVASAGWLELAVVPLLFTLPVTGERRLPLLMVANAILAVGFWTSPRLRWSDMVAGRRAALTVFGLGGGLALAGMLAVTAGYVLDLKRPATVTPHPETGWWWPYLGWYVGVTAAALLAASYFRRATLAPLATIPTVAALLLGLRMAYAEAPIDRASWLPLLCVVGAATVGIGLTVRARAVVGHVMSESFGTQIAGAGALIGGGGLGGCVALSMIYIGNITRPYVVEHGDEPLWWWRVLVVYVVAVVASWLAGHHFAQPEWVLPVVGFGALALLVVLRMATTDLVLWTYAAFAAAGLAYLSHLAGWPSGSAAFDVTLCVWLLTAGLLAAAVALPGNLLLSGIGRTDERMQAVVYAAIGLGVFGAGLRERRPVFTYGAVAAVVLALGFAIDASGVAARNGAYAFAALSWLLVGGALTVPTQGRWVGQRSVWEHCAYAVGVLPILLALAVQGLPDPQSPVFQQLVLAVLSLAGILAVVAVARQDVVRGYVASVLGLAAALMQIAVTEPGNPQAYSAPIALYLLGASWTRRHDPRIYDPLTGAGAALLLVPSLAQSFGPGGFIWALLCGAEALGFVVLGLVLGRRTPLAAGVVGLTLVVLRQTLDAANALPSWAIMGLVGVLLLGIGTLALAAREVLIRWVEVARSRWAILR